MTHLKKQIIAILCLFAFLMAFMGYLEYLSGKLYPARDHYLLFHWGSGYILNFQIVGSILLFVSFIIIFFIMKGERADYDKEMKADNRLPKGTQDDPFPVFACNHIWGPILTTGYQHCKECGIARPVEHIQCKQHKLEIISRIEVEDRLFVDEIIYVNRCEHCGEIQDVRIKVKP